MKKHAGLFAATAVLVLAGAGCSGSGTTSTNTAANTPPPPQPAAEGRAVITVKDEATAMTGVSSIVVVVNKVDVHSAAKGWVTVSTATKSYDLIKLKGSGVSQLLADVNLAADTYDQIRLNVSKVTVTANGKSFDAKLPSNILRIVGNLTVTGDQTSTASLDFQADKSLHLTGNGTYVLAPVVRYVTTDDASVTVKSDQSVVENGGSTETDETVGEDTSGNMESNFELPDKLELDTSGHIIVKP